MSIFANKTLLITGGTGSFGHAVLDRFISTDIEEIRKYRDKQMETLYEEVKRLLNPHIYYVDLSKDLWFKKQEMLMKSKYTKEK